LHSSRESLFQKLTSNPYLMLSIAMILWACNTVAARLAVGNVSPMILVLMRWVIACAVLFFIAREPLKADWPVLRRHLPYIFFMGALGYTAFNALFYVAGHHTTAINMGILQGSMPILVLIAGALALRETATPIQWLGTILTMIGIGVVASGGDIARLKQLTFNIGDIYMLIACVFYAGYTVGLRKRPAVSSLGFFAVMAVAATLTSLPLAAAEYARGELIWPNLKGWLVILFIALGPSLMAQLTFMRGVQLIGAVRSGIFINLVPVIGPLFAIIALGENFGWHHAVALALVLGGIALAESGRQR
jgi:drug/metabolite transporter (DMT)-like permease